jgi:[NiFe] hydrogenase diaphorase moiety large subunit
MEQIRKILSGYNFDRTCLIDMIRDVRQATGSVSDEAVTEIARELKISRVDVEGVASFYHFVITGSSEIYPVRKKGRIIFSEFSPGSAIRMALSMTPDTVIDEIKKSNLRGRGGAGFPTGLKWELCRKSTGNRHIVICNAEEGEPGTFKDHILLTELPRMIFEGMVLGAFAINADHGILYLRAEYDYLMPFLENALENMRKENLLGRNIAGKAGFDFDIRIIVGAGAYICGEESALIESAEGHRGEPRNRPPFPVESGYLGYPTVVNNVETFCCAVRIIEKGADWFRASGTPKSSGTKLLSVSGDCGKPGVYEAEFGITVRELLEMTEAENTQAVQVGGPSGTCISGSQFQRKICYEDLATGGSIIVIDKSRNLLEIVRNFMKFFVDESCGYCVPCRAGNVLLKNMLEKILRGNGTEKELKEMEELGKIVKSMSRCGLGQTSPNPVLSTLQNFPELYLTLVNKDKDFISEFDMAKATNNKL